MDFTIDTMEHFDLRHLLGTWELVGMSTPEMAGLRKSFGASFGYISENELSFTLNGKMA